MSKLVLTPHNPRAIDLVPIPAGSFLMGSPDDEPGRYEDEGPQHEVTFFEAFCLSRTPITQAQWRVVAGWPMVERELNPDPSYFKGDDRPVEQVSWYDAMEFCARLSKRAGRTYTLPSEAQWEYACRAGTITPFAFGDTLTPEMARFDSGETTEVGLFPANAWGLQDMHGNVWEWCLDHWHEDYEGAPVDGSAWIEEGLGKSSGVARGTVFPGTVARPSASGTPRTGATFTSVSASASGDESLGKSSGVVLGSTIPGSVARPSASGTSRATASTTSASASASALGAESLGKSSGAALGSASPGIAARRSAIASLPRMSATPSDSASAASHKMLRGGSWYDDPRNCRSACREGGRPGDRYDHFGFRVCCLPQC